MSGVCNGQNGTGPATIVPHRCAYVGSAPTTPLSSPSPITPKVTFGCNSRMLCPADTYLFALKGTLGSTDRLKGVPAIVAGAGPTFANRDCHTVPLILRFSDFLGLGAS